MKNPTNTEVHASVMRAKIARRCKSIAELLAMKDQDSWNVVATMQQVERQLADIETSLIQEPTK